MRKKLSKNVTVIEGTSKSPTEKIGDLIQGGQKKYYNFEKDDFIMRIQDVKSYGVPDFGLQEQVLFGQLAGSPSNATVLGGSPCKGPSKWKLFYDAIKKYPKFEMLKNFIEKAQKVKKTKDEEAKSKQLNDFITKHQRKSNLGVSWAGDRSSRAIED